MKAPFPYFGGKSKIASEVWDRLGNCQNYIEPFFGSGAVLLGRPDEHKWWDQVETANDADGLLCNFWRSVKYDPETVAKYADWPTNENDLHAHHSLLVNSQESMANRLEGDPNYFDAKMAGWWVWGISIWIGSGWCVGSGGWTVEEDEEGFKVLEKTGKKPGVSRQIPRLSSGGSGIFGINTRHRIPEVIDELCRRLRWVRVCCGDWKRVLGPWIKRGKTPSAIFLDPPYTKDMHSGNMYAGGDDCAHQVLDWCVENGDNDKLRIALCGYEGEHNKLEDLGWSVFEWKASGGFGVQGQGRGRDNAFKERVWFSPYCLAVGE